MPLDENTLASFPEEIRSDPSLQNFDDVGSIAKSYLETKRMVGNSVQLPKKDTSPEDLARWKSEQLPKLAAAGLYEMPPESPDKYDFKWDGVLPEQIKDDKFLEAAKPLLHKYGLSNAKAAGLIADFAKEILPGIIPKVNFIEGEGVRALLAKSLGAEADTRIEEYKRGVAALAADGFSEINDFLNEPMAHGENEAIAIGDHPFIVKLISEIARLKAQDFGGSATGTVTGESIESVRTQIADLRANKDLDPEEIGRRLDPLYKKLVLLRGGK